jgi:hypothetical protein
MAADMRNRHRYCKPPSDLLAPDKPAGRIFSESRFHHRIKSEDRLFRIKLYPSLMPANLITLLHLAFSSAMSLR